ncbi:MAG: hypothetical protein SWO11_06385, partial [Thermodesulfobacteriota bacterium]|nr:hypothetical protein [Thermodesulfobacteriota bacterium]
QADHFDCAGIRVTEIYSDAAQRQRADCQRTFLTTQLIYIDVWCRRVMRTDSRDGRRKPEP